MCSMYRPHILQYTLSRLNLYVCLTQIFKQRLSKYFPTEAFGRRAPWFVTHLPVIMLTIVLINFPPQSSSKNATWITYLWFGAVMLLAKWSSSVVGIAVNAAIDEIFPAQMERVQIWGLNVFAIWTAIIIAIVASNSIIGDADNSPERCCDAQFEENLGNNCEMILNETLNTTLYIYDDTFSLESSTAFLMTAVMILFSFVGICGLSTMRLAKQPANKEEVGASTWQNIAYFARWPAFQLLFVHAAAEAMGNTMLTTFAAFYITYVLAFPRDEFAAALITVTIMGMIVQFLSAGLGSWFFGTASENSKAGSRSVAPYGVAGCLISAVLSTLLLILADSGYEDDGRTKKKGNFVLICLTFVVARFFQTPSQIFNSVARGWIVDIDVHRSKSSARREALIQSATTCAVNTAGILVTPLLASVSIAGLDTTLCWGEPQSKGSVAYLKWMIIIINPILLIIRAYCIYMFPVDAARAAEIESVQRDIYVKPVVEKGGGSGAKVVPSEAV